VESVRRVIQVGIVQDHFQCQSGPKSDLPASVMPRIRHCVECSTCLTLYLVSCSPYGNGSYLLPTIRGCRDEYILYCRCKAAASRWKSSEFKNCDVSTAAFERGYGTTEEITVIHAWQQEWTETCPDISTNGRRWRSRERSHLHDAAAVPVIIKF